MTYARSAIVGLIFCSFACTDDPLDNVKPVSPPPEGMHDAGPSKERHDATPPPQAPHDAGPPPAITLNEQQSLLPDPSWACGMKDGIPGPLTGQFAFDIDFDVGTVHDLGDTPFGHRRRIDVRGGAIDGAKVRGRVLNWGLEHELTLSNGVREVEQVHVLALGDERVFMRNCGVSPGPDSAVRVVLDFEAAQDGPHAFLNTGRYVATRVFDEQLKLLRLKVYEVTAATLDDAMQVTKPTDKPAQPWECAKGTKGRGAPLFQAVVDLAGYWSVGESKHGKRNIVPILGGPVNGKLAGRIVTGGGDYQLGADPVALDARYMLETDDGERILVRNCGLQGALIPTFETREDGPYAWLNHGDYLSADPVPKPDLTGINLAIYEAE